jgi:hypothetical protein
LGNVKVEVKVEVEVKVKVKVKVEAKVEAKPNAHSRWTGLRKWPLRKFGAGPLKSRALSEPARSLIPPASYGEFARV